MDPLAIVYVLCALLPVFIIIFAIEGNNGGDYQVSSLCFLIYFGFSAYYGGSALLEWNKNRQLKGDWYLSEEPRWLGKTSHTELTAVDFLVLRDGDITFLNSYGSKSGSSYKTMHDTLAYTIDETPNIWKFKFQKGALHLFLPTDSTVHLEYKKCRPGTDVEKIWLQRTSS